MKVLEDDFDGEYDFDFTNQINYDKWLIFKDQPQVIRGFMSWIRKELDVSGNMLSFIIQEELSIVSADQGKQIFQTYSKLLQHLKIIWEIVVTLLLDCLIKKWTSGIKLDPSSRFSSNVEDKCLIYLNVFKGFDSTLNPLFLNISQLFEAKIRYPIENKLNPYGFTPDTLVDKSKGFTLEKWSTKAKLLLGECWKTILDSKFLLIKTIIKKSFDSLLEELTAEKEESPKRHKEELKFIEIIEANPLTSVRPYILEVLEIISSFLIKAYDFWGIDVENIFSTKLISFVFTIESDYLTQYEFELPPVIIKQIYFEFEFVSDILDNFLNKNSQCDQKASELAQKMLQLVLKSEARTQSQLSNSKFSKSGLIEDKDVFSEEELSKISKSIRNLKFIHENNFKILL